MIALIESKQNKEINAPISNILKEVRIHFMRRKEVDKRDFDNLKKI